MNDRELLELAAKAAGLSVIDCGGLGLRIRSDGCKTGYMWNPLTDDGDALRLAVKLHIDQRIWNGTVEAIWIDEALSETHSVEVPCDESFEGMPAKYAAARRAIVRAAAEIGRQK